MRRIKDYYFHMTYRIDLFTKYLLTLSTNLSQRHWRDRTANTASHMYIHIGMSAKMRCPHEGATAENFSQFEEHRRVIGESPPVLESGAGVQLTVHSISVARAADPDPDLVSNNITPAFTQAENVTT